MLSDGSYAEVLRVVGKGGDHKTAQQRHLHGLLKTEPGACQCAPYDGGNGQHPQELHGGGGLFALQRENQRSQQEEKAVARIADYHGKKQGEKAQKPEGNVIFPIARDGAQNVKHGDHQLGDLIVFDLGGDLVVITGGILQRPSPVRLGCGLFEAVHLRRRNIPPQPDQAVLTLGRVADGGILGVILRLEHLRLDAG